MFTFSPPNIGLVHAFFLLYSDVIEKPQQECNVFIKITALPTTVLRLIHTYYVVVWLFAVFLRPC
jgi:hypothetical protein